MKRNTWHPVDNYPEIIVGQYVVPNFVSNSVSIQVSDNEFILYSPGESLLDSWPHKDIQDLKLHILIPNAYHFMGVAAWKKHFPKAQLYASELALKQLKPKKDFAFAEDVFILEKANLPLPLSYEVLFPPGHRAGDVWLKKYNTEGSLWVTCDSFLNYERLSNQPVARLMQKVLGAAPGLKMSQVIKWFILDDRKEFKAWALELARMDKPSTLIPSHGELGQSVDLYEDIIGLLETRL